MLPFKIGGKKSGKKSPKKSGSKASLASSGQGPSRAPPGQGATRAPPGQGATHASPGQRPYSPGQMLYITNNEMYNLYSNQPLPKPTRAKFCRAVVCEVLATIDIPYGDDLSDDDYKIKDDFAECLERVERAFQRFKVKYIDNKQGRKLVAKDGELASKDFFNLKKEYPQLVRKESSQSQSQDPNASFVDKEVPKPSARTRKLFRKLCPGWKRQKTDDIYKMLFKKAEELNCTVNELLAHLGYRANYLDNKKVAAAFMALSEGDLVGTMSLDKALYMKTRYKLSKREWIDLRIDLEGSVIMPTDKEVRAYSYKLLPDCKLKPFHGHEDHPDNKGWYMEVQDAVEARIQRLPEKAKAKIAKAKGRLVCNFSLGCDG